MSLLPVYLSILAQHRCHVYATLFIPRARLFAYWYRLSQLAGALACWGALVRLLRQRDQETRCQRAVATERRAAERRAAERGAAERRAAERRAAALRQVCVCVRG